MSNAIAVNLRRLRKLRALTQDQLAQTASISRVAYRSIETGKAAPRSRTLDALAHALKVDVFALVAPAPAPKTLRFRSNTTLSAQERAEREQLVVETLHWLADFGELEALLNDRITAVLPHPQSRSHDIGRLAEDLRVRAFKIATTGWQPEICDVLEQGGIKVRIVRSTIKGVFGFSLSAQDGGPAVVVNTHESIPVERRIFTAAHELGHLILHQDSFDPTVETEDAKQEHEADMFASHFLMPDAQFKEEWDRNRGLDWVDRTLKTKRVFRVSWLTVLYRLCEMGAADKSRVFWQFRSAYKAKYDKVIASKSEPEPGDPASPTRPNQEPARLSDFDFCEDRFLRLVRVALEKDEISVSRAAEMLAKPVQEVRSMLAEWEQHK